MLTQKEQPKVSRMLALVLGLGFVLRLVLAASTEGYPYDTSCFFAWGGRMAELGAADFYAADYFCDYPPAYLYLLGLVSKIMTLFGVNYQEKLAQMLLVFVPALAEVALAAGLFYAARRFGNSRIALRLAGFVMFCPMFWYDTAVWKQIDAVLAVLVVACFYALSQGRYLPAAALYGLSLAVKPQALILGPVLALCFLLPVFTAKDLRAFWRAIATGMLGVLSALAPIYLCGLPFFGFGGTVQGLYNLYTTTATSYPYASVNAFNFISFCGGNWVTQSDAMSIALFGTKLALPFSWAGFGSAAILLTSVFVLVLGVRAHRSGRFSPLLLSAVYMMGVFTFGHRMHERYLLLGVALLLGAVAQFASARLLGLAGGFSLAVLLNMAVVYTVVDTDDSFLTSATSLLTMRVVGLAETLLCLLLCYEAWQICGGACRAHTLFRFDDAQGKEQTVAGVSPVMSGKKGDQNTQQAEQPSKWLATPAPQPKWSRTEVVCVSLLTAFVAVLSFTYLGDFTAPQKSLDATQTPHSETVVLSGDATQLWVYPGVTQDNANLTLWAMDGTELLNVTMPVAGLFQWTVYDIPAQNAYLISLSGAQMMELGFKDASGTLLQLDTAAMSSTVTGQGISALFDEQNVIPQKASQLNGFYFDEIYHARTAYESTQGLSIYEISHPPMGKNFIALGTLVFGMTGFGWRFAGTVFGVLLVPVIYWLTRRLTRTPLAAGLVAALLGVDFMRFSQSRIATIDVISAFFILLAATCMVWYCQSVLQYGVKRSVLPMALSGISFGFGAASKWTGLYGGVGLAILYFGVFAVRYYQRNMAFEHPKLAGAQAISTGETATNKKARQKKLAHKKAISYVDFVRETAQETALMLWGGVLFFVVVPAIIYMVSYLPYFLADPNFGFKGIIENQDYMYWYHSTLDATHPFSSAWYSWFLDLRPVWYYMGGRLPADTHASIAGFYNPIVCWVGAVAWLRLCLRALTGKARFTEKALIVLLLSQLMPWLLVTRCTFLYHYFPSFLFTVVAIGLWFQDLLCKHKTRALTLGSGLVTLAAFFFIWFYPVLSGLPVGQLWAKTLALLPSYGFYII